MSIIKRTVDSVYAFRFLELLRKPFTQWSAYRKGIIDDKGHAVKTNLSSDEKREWTHFHKMTANIKRMLMKGPSKTSELTALYTAYRTMRESYDIGDDTDILKEFPLLEMVSGDAGGDSGNIASGQNSGAVVYPGPGKLKSKKKKVKRMSEVVGFKDFIKANKEAEIAEAARLQAEAEAAKQVKTFSFKSIGSNAVVVEANAGGVVSVDISGKTSNEKVDAQAVKEAYDLGGSDAVLAYVKEATDLVWKSVAV